MDNDTFYPNFTLAQQNGSNGTDDHFENTSLKQLYAIFVPLLFFFCLLSILVNIRVLLAVHWIRRPLSATLHISLSLAAADACSSALLAIGLLINSYLPPVFGIEFPCWISSFIEIYRLSSVIITVVHLLALSVHHWLGILAPLKYTTMITFRKLVTVTFLLWIVPISFFNLYFFSTSEQPMTLNAFCNVVRIQRFNFRVLYSSLFFLPMLIMVMCYSHILYIVRKQQKVWAKLSRSGSKRCKGLSRSNTQHRRAMEGNVRAVCTTLLILGSCLIGWLPAVLSYLLICSDCPLTVSHLRWPPVFDFAFSYCVNLLLILKTLANPIIYSARMIEIKEGMRRMQMALSRVFCNSNRSRDRYMSNLQPLQLGYSGSMHGGVGGVGVTALCKLNGSGSTRRSIRSHYPNTLV